jgi:hypothetical protein
MSTAETSVTQYLPDTMVFLQFVCYIRYYLTVEQADGSRSILRVVLGVCYHYYGCSLTVEFLKKQHNLLAVL